jgi:hypothetical protein
MLLFADLKLIVLNAAVLVLHVLYTAEGDLRKSSVYMIIPFFMVPKCDELQETGHVSLISPTDFSLLKRAANSTSVGATVSCGRCLSTPQ